MKSGYDVILKPIITEQSMDMSADKKYVFKVADTANKTEVRQAVEEIFGVDVAKVNIMNVNGKVKRMGRTVGRTASYKKASAEYEVPLAPAGEFWWDCRREHPETEMYYEDGTHASEAGSEFAAGYIYRAISADMKKKK